MIKNTKRTDSIELSTIRKLFEVTNPNAINLGIGEPDFEVPENIKEAMKKGIDDGFTHYTSNKGFDNLREAIVLKLKEENNIETDMDDVIVTCGASEALFDCCQALFEKGDEVLIPNPGFLSYEAGIKLAEASPVGVETPMENGFKLTADDVQEKISNKTKGLIINSPSNPTGAVMEKEDIKAIAELATDYNFMVISDEIYEKIIYDNKKHYSPAAFGENVITLNGFSKAYAMTGLRLAYMVSPKYITEDLLKVHQYATACASSISQIGGIEALTGPQESVNKMVREFKRRRDLICDSLNDMGYECIKGEGAFYVFPKVNNPEIFVKKAMDAGVICVPGLAFGSAGQDFVRMSYANSYENIEKAMDILKNMDK
ncbi:pyridoxal phosphate-dependent aminotransferase [Methanobrevibacter sp.]